MPDNSGQGIQLACSNCHEQWWEIKKESINSSPSQHKNTISEQPFRNLTDISMLYQRQSGNYAYQETPKEPAVAFTARAETRTYAKQSANEEVALKPTSWKLVLRAALWSVLVFGSIVALALIAMQYPTTSLIPTTKHAQTPVSPGEISIENIEFHLVSLDESHQKVIVIGNVKNPGPLSVPLHNIKISAWGTCVEGQSPNEQGLCQIRVWPYEWKQDLLQPGETLTFKSAAKIPVNLQVDQVHVDDSN